MGKKVAIIGAGASGLFCAIECASAGCEVVVFEQNSKCAKKILVSGNGRCNISNANLSLSNYHTQNPNFLNYPLKNFSFDMFEKKLKEYGLLLNTLEDGRAYPLSNEAKSVAKLFEELALVHGVIFHYDAKIDDIKNFLQKYDAVVIATGGRAGEHLGGNDDGERFAKSCGHNIIPTYPSLVQLEIDSKTIHKMAGAKTEAEVTLLINHKKDISVNGDLLFTNYGVSGFAILDISQKASLALNEFSHVSISINLLPNFTMQQLSTHILNTSKTMKSFSIYDILIGLIPTKIASNLLISIDIDPNSNANATLTPKTAKKIANTLTNWRFEIEDTHGFRHAEVSGGGVDTLEIDEKTMMSKKQKNLYFTGEVLDVVGDRGGYNFAFAWASAYTCSQDIIKNLKD